MPEGHAAVRSHHQVGHAAVVEGYPEPGLGGQLQGSGRHEKKVVALKDEENSCGSKGINR